MHVQVLYNLCEWPTRPGARLAVVGIANTLDLPERLLPRIASRLGGRRVVFQPYKRDQLKRIVEERLRGAGVCHAFHENAIKYAAGKVSCSCTPSCNGRFLDCERGNPLYEISLCRTQELLHFCCNACCKITRTAVQGIDALSFSPLNRLPGLSSVAGLDIVHACRQTHCVHTHRFVLIRSETCHYQIKFVHDLCKGNQWNRWRQCRGTREERWSCAARRLRSLRRSRPLPTFPPPPQPPPAMHPPPPSPPPHPSHQVGRGALYQHVSFLVAKLTGLESFGTEWTASLEALLTTIFQGAFPPPAATMQMNASAHTRCPDFAFLAASLCHT